VQAIAPRSIESELADGEEEQAERRRGESLIALGGEPDQEIDEINWDKDRQREKEAVEQFSSRAEIFKRVAAEQRAAPKVAADVGCEPEAIEAGAVSTSSNAPLKTNRRNPLSSPMKAALSERDGGGGGKETASCIFLF
jgi:hypothetical protein